MKIKHQIIVSIALGLPVATHALPPGFSLEQAGVDTKAVTQEEKDATRQETSDTAILAASLGVPDKAFIAGKTRTARKAILQKAQKKASYQKSAKTGAIIDRRLVFGNGSAQLTEGARARVLLLANVYKQTPQIQQISVTGHTNTVGNNNANMQLSQQRANSVKKELVALGVPAQIIVAKGHGESMLLPGISGASADNRRVEYAIQLPKK